VRFLVVFVLFCKTTSKKFVSARAPSPGRPGDRSAGTAAVSRAKMPLESISIL
jgi:hypothetical protein